MRIFCELPDDSTAAEALAVLAVKPLVRRDHPNVCGFYRADVPLDFDTSVELVAPRSRIGKWLLRRKLNRLTYQTITVTVEGLRTDTAGTWWILRASRTHDRKPWLWRARLIRWWAFEK